MRRVKNGHEVGGEGGWEGQRSWENGGSGLSFRVLWPAALLPPQSKHPSSTGQGRLSQVCQQLPLAQLPTYRIYQAKGSSPYPASQASLTRFLVLETAQACTWLHLKCCRSSFESGNRRFLQSLLTPADSCATMERRHQTGVVLGGVWAWQSVVPVPCYPQVLLQAALATATACAFLARSQHLSLSTSDILTVS